MFSFNESRPVISVLNFLGVRCLSIYISSTLLPKEILNGGLTVCQFCHMLDVIFSGLQWKMFLFLTAFYKISVILEAIPKLLYNLKDVVNETCENCYFEWLACFCPNYDDWYFLEFFVFLHTSHKYLVLIINFNYLSSDHLFLSKLHFSVYYVPHY
jgi:hypothetical protein